MDALDALEADLEGCPSDGSREDADGGVVVPWGMAQRLGLPVAETMESSRALRRRVVPHTDEVRPARLGCLSVVFMVVPCNGAGVWNLRGGCSWQVAGEQGCFVYRAWLCMGRPLHCLC